MDFLSAYERVINIIDAPQAHHLWSLIIINIHGKMFDCFSEFNNTILNSIEIHKESYKFGIPLKRRCEDEVVYEPPNKKPRYEEEDLIRNFNNSIYISQQSSAKRIRINK